MRGRDLFGESRTGPDESSTAWYWYSVSAFLDERPALSSGVVRAEGKQEPRGYATFLITKQQRSSESNKESS